MSENKSESFSLSSSCDNKPVETLRNHTQSLEILLKEVYSKHKETIRLCREEHKHKFDKMVALKNKMFEKGKEIQKECNNLKKENQDLKAALSRTDASCKNCDHLRRSFDSLEEAYKRSLSEKEKMIQYLEAQLNGQHHSFTSDQNKNASPKSSPENQKNNRLRLKVSQKRAFYKGSPEENANQNPPSMRAKNTKPSPTAPLLNVPETCFPDTCATETTDKKSVESNELTVIPDTLALFNPWDSDFETDQDNSDGAEETVDKCLVVESPCNKSNILSDTDLVRVASGESSKNITIQKKNDSIPKAAFSDKEICEKSNSCPTSPVVSEPSEKLNDSDKTVTSRKSVLSDLGNTFKSPTKSPLRKKRKQSSNENFSPTKKDEKPEKKMETNENETTSLLQFVQNGQNVKRLSFEEKKFSRRSRSRENNKAENCEFDADQTLPPENWGNETLISDSEIEHKENMSVDADDGDALIWQTASEPVFNSLRKTEMTQMNGSLAPSMQMTQFLEENEGCTEAENCQGKKLKEKSDIMEVESCSQTFPSRSYKFGAVAKSPALTAVEDVVAVKPEQKITEESFCDSFDHVPKKKEIGYAYHSVVRKKAERRRLNGYTCRECAEYYKAKGLTEEEIRLQVGDCSRHRAKYEAPQTPEHFWSVGFPDTMECENRGYFVKDDSKSPVSKQFRRRRRLQQSKTAVDKEDPKQKKEADEEIGMTQMLEYLSAESGDED